ncbi:MAG: AAA family ATPase [Candidatus Obscuribacter sp.]|nr:AAA family ATPase [Candidatus Obscuribacter sp.]MBK9277419.1 AAA family ATPase [Candidatus Obscuribacter sp.]
MTNMAKIILMVGIPGSGKTTLSQRVVSKGFHYLNADSIRLELYGDEKEQGKPEDVFAIFFARLEEAMEQKKNIIIDNTNLNPRQRKPILERALQFGYEDVQLWLLDVPLELCLERNRKRERAVPDDIVSNMYTELYKNGRPKRVEGKVVVIRPSQDGSDYLFFPQS